MDLRATGMIGICNECKQRIPIYDTHVRLLMATHGVFEVGPGEPNVTCPSSLTTNFEIVANPNLGIKDLD